MLTRDIAEPRNGICDDLYCLIHFLFSVKPWKRESKTGVSLVKNKYVK